MSSDMREKSHSVGYQEGLSGKKPPIWGGFCPSEEYLAGLREGYEAFLRNKDLADRVSAVTTRQLNSDNRSEENEERRHRELLETLKDRVILNTIKPKILMMW